MGPGDFAPNRSLILWPFTDLSDPRFHLGQNYWTIAHDAKRGATKIGINFNVGKIGYFNGGTLFVKSVEFDKAATYPDRDSHIEIFANQEILEVETLGPLTKLKPGGVLEWVEEWELFGDVAAFNPTNQNAIAEAVGNYL